jgi:hypothetical protein
MLKDIGRLGMGSHADGRSHSRAQGGQESCGHGVQPRWRGRMCKGDGEGDEVV